MVARSRKGEWEVFVSDREMSRSGGGGGRSGLGWLIWLGVIVGVNVLSWAFNWGFWLY